ncbi:MAG: hypothetical protein HY695_14320 [Deltaproteobacteria bacterium]|nr:hypothetical protein [Deltaproteobacteria bacterium]
MSRISFIEDFIGHNVSSAPLQDRPSFFNPAWDVGTGGATPKLELVSEDGGSCCRFLSSDETDRFVGLVLAFPKAQAKRHPVFGGRLMFRNDYLITHQQTWFGFSETWPPTTAAADDFHGFFLDNTATLENWKWVHRSNGAEASGDTGIVAAQEFWHEFEIALSPKEATFALNGKVVHGINRDASTLDLYWSVITKTRTGAVREMLLDLLYGSQDR